MNLWISLNWNALQSVYSQCTPHRLFQVFTQSFLLLTQVTEVPLVAADSVFKSLHQWPNETFEHVNHVLRVNYSTNNSGIILSLLATAIYSTVCRVQVGDQHLLCMRGIPFHYRWNFHSLVLSLPGTFAPWNLRSLGLSYPGTFAPESESDVELSLPGTFVL